MNGHQQYHKYRRRHLVSIFSYSANKNAITSPELFANTFHLRNHINYGFASAFDAATTKRAITVIIMKCVLLRKCNGIVSGFFFRWVLAAFGHWYLAVKLILRDCHVAGTCHCNLHCSKSLTKLKTCSRYF